MSIGRQIAALCLMFLISFFHIRGYLSGVKMYQLNNSAYRKRKKGESFKEWLFYSRYKREIPKAFLILYYYVILIHLGNIFTCLLFYIIKPLSFIGGIIVIVVALTDSIWMIVLKLLFWTPGARTPYERWITKVRGQKRGKK